MSEMRGSADSETEQHAQAGVSFVGPVHRVRPGQLAAGIATVILLLAGLTIQVRTRSLGTCLHGVDVPPSTGCALAQGETGQGMPHDDQTPRGCTIFTISHGDRVFFGGNSDWHNFDCWYYWVDPGSAGSYGAIYFGVPDNVQQGFNEKGLAYDANGLPETPVTVHPGELPVEGNYGSYPIQILQKCATVEEVITWVQTHRWHRVMHDQLHFADASGDAVVISAGPDGKVAYTRKRNGDGFLVSTNFNLADSDNSRSLCWRYRRTEELLQQFDNRQDLTTENAATVLNAVHVASPNGFTVMSVLGDLPRGLVYVYPFHQFDAPIILNVAEEIRRAPEPGPLRDSFPQETLNKVDQAYEKLMRSASYCDVAGYTWLGLVIASLAVLFLLGRPRGRDLALWMPMVIVLGPLGLLVRLITAGGRRTLGLVEAAGDLSPSVIGMMGTLLAVVLVPHIGQDLVLQLVTFYGFTLIVGHLLYQSPLLTSASGSSYARTVLHNLPGALVSTNLALAGFLTIGAPLIQLSLGVCRFGGVTLLSWWCIAVLSAVVGGLPLTLYHTWTLRYGFATWSALLCGREDAGDAVTTVSAPPGRRLWLWVLLSFTALVAGAAIGSTGSALIAGLQ